MTEIRLDLRDKKILSELEMNARVSHSFLAKKLQTSKQVIKYRIEKLEKEGIIQGYNAIVDLTKLGQTIYIIYLKLFRLSSTKEHEWIKQIESSANVLGVGKNTGKWDLTIALRAKNNQELDSILKEIFAGKGENIKEKLITSEIESTYFSTSIIHKGNNKEVTTSSINENLKIDKKDEKIINSLSDNCQISLLDLAEKVAMSPNGVKNKINNLEKDKIILGYKTKINYEKLGYLHFRVFLHLDNFSKVLYNKIISSLRIKGNVESVSRYLGYADVDFRCYSKSLEELYQLISGLKDAFLNDIIDVDSMPIFRWEKIRYYS